MMNEKDLLKSYWAKAANTTACLMNRCITSGVHDVTPHEKFFGKKSDLSHVRIFSWIAYVHIPDEKLQKLDPTSEKSILVGYSLEQKGYKKLYHSTRENNLVSIFGYNEYMAYHYAFMMKVMTIWELEKFSEVAKDRWWVEAMNEQMQALCKNETWDFEASTSCLAFEDH